MTTLLTLAYKAVKSVPIGTNQNNGLVTEPSKTLSCTGPSQRILMLLSKLETFIFDKYYETA